MGEGGPNVQTLNYKKISSGDEMYNMMTRGKNIALYIWKLLKE